MWVFFQCSGSFGLPSPPETTVHVGEWLNHFHGWEKGTAKVFLIALGRTWWKRLEMLIPVGLFTMFVVRLTTGYWSDLQKPKVQKAMQRVHELVKKDAQEVLRRSHGWAPTLSKNSRWTISVTNDSVWSL